MTELIRKIIQQLDNYLEHYFRFLPVSSTVNRSTESCVHFSMKLIHFDGQDKFYGFQFCDASNKVFPLGILVS